MIGEVGGDLLFTKPRTFHRCGVFLIIAEETLNSAILLKELNMRMRFIWASTSVLIKPWNGGLPRGKDGNFFTAAIGDIAARIDQALKKLPALFKNPAVSTGAGAWSTTGPRPPSSPT